MRSVHVAVSLTATCTERTEQPSIPQQQLCAPINVAQAIYSCQSFNQNDPNDLCRPKPEYCVLSFDPEKRTH